MLSVEAVPAHAPVSGRESARVALLAVLRIAALVVVAVMRFMAKRTTNPPPEAEHGRVPSHLRMDLNNPDFWDEPPPSMLYHYTTAAGLTGIVGSECRLQATDHRLLNDSDELAYGRAIALDVLESLSNLDPEVKERTKAELSELLGETSFVACLSNSQNILPQWRLYANETAGYCVGFKDPRSADYVDDEGNSVLTYDLYRCWYDEAELRERLTQRYERKISRLEKVSGTDKTEILAQDLALVAWRYTQLGKHEHFKFESEWRFVVRNPAHYTQYRLSARGLTPYLLTDKLDLAEVWVGPGVGPTREKACETVTEFLAKHGLSAAVYPWKTSYRR